MSYEPLHIISTTAAACEDTDEPCPETAFASCPNCEAEMHEVLPGCLLCLICARADPAVVRSLMPPPQEIVPWDTGPPDEVMEMSVALQELMKQQGGDARAGADVLSDEEATDPCPVVETLKACTTAVKPMHEAEEPDKTGQFNLGF